VDLLAHPGLISLKDARQAASRSIALEITSRAGHNRTNGHVAAVARGTGCILVVDSDAHGPHDLLPAGARRLVARGAGLSEAEARNSLDLNIPLWLGKRV
jgi:histidinol phosphatase-like PHP family hydrolase